MKPVDFANMSGLSVDNPKGYYWRGADGNVWVQGDQGINSAGAWDANTERYWNAFGYQQTPNSPGEGSIPSGGNAPGGGGGGPAPKVFNQAGADATQRSINELQRILPELLLAEEAKYKNANTDFDRQEQTQTKQYGESTNQNQLNYDSNFMDSIRGGIKGLGGLMSLLRGTGAGGGTAEDLARETVGGVTANDIRTGADTQKENQGGLDSSFNSFKDDLGRKRKTNDDTFENNKRAVTRDTQTELQELFGTMAGFYGDVGNQGEAGNWIRRGSDLTPSIASNRVAKVSAYDTAPAAYKAPELTAFAAPTQPSVVTAPNGQVGSGLFTMDSRRRKEALPVGV